MYFDYWSACNSCKLHKHTNIFKVEDGQRKHITCPIRVKKTATTDGFPWIDSPTLSPSDILSTKRLHFISGA